MIINEIVPAKVAFPPATDVNGTVAAPQTTEEESLHPASIQQQRGAPSAGYTIVKLRQGSGKDRQGMARDGP